MFDVMIDDFSFLFFLLTMISWRDLLHPSWKLVFAIVAFLDISVCWSVVVDGWNESSKQSEEPEQKKKLEFLFVRRKEDPLEDICSAPSAWSYVGTLFCCLCLIEALIRALEARQIAFETAALDNFEHKLAKLYSTTRCSVFRQQPSEDDFREGHKDLILARNTLRVWTPVITVLFSWFVLIPWLTFGEHECVHDSAIATMATVWLTKSMTQTKIVFEAIKGEVLTYLWKAMLPWKTWLQPKRLMKRIKDILRWIRYFRFAGPLLRLCLKLQDQFWVFTKTWRQAIEARAEKAKRMAQRSMMFSDLDRIESLAKLNTALASIPSQLQVQAHDLRNKLLEKQEQAKRLKRRIDGLKREIRHGSIAFPTSKIYDQIIDLRQELTSTVITALMSSNLVSPHTRFSVGWRVIVTFALVAELFRLYYSWYLAGTFDISLTDMISSLLVECDQKMMERFRLMTRRGKPIRHVIGKVFRLPNVELAECRPTSSSARLILQLGKIFESTIDIVWFLDIFVWFFTGELDSDGVIVPKPFFSRCILPGTLVQVLDHPTLPDKLPHLIFCFMDASKAAGYSRVIRWALAIYPAFEMLVVDPIRSYLFRPMDDDEYLNYTESWALIPQVFSQTNIRKSGMPSHPSRKSGISSHQGEMMLPFPSFSEHLDRASSAGNVEESFGFFQY